MMQLIPRTKLASDLLDSEPTVGSYNGVTSDGVANAVGDISELIPDDASSSNKLATQADVTTVEEQIEAIGKPLQWKGPATVAQLNAGITGIQEGWTYTLTDSGTLTDGSVAVEIGDEVAWTEDGEWFKVGGESSKIAVFTGTYDHTATPPVFTGLPDTTAIAAAIDAGKYVVLQLTNNGSVFSYVLGLSNPGYKLFYRTVEESLGAGYGTYHPGLVMTYGGPGNPWGWSPTKFDIDRCLVFDVSYNSSTSSYTWPSYSDIAAVFGGNLIVLGQITQSGDHNVYILDEWSYGNYFHFIGKDGTWLKIDSLGNVSTGYIVSVHNGGSVAQSSGYASVENNALTTITGVNVAALEVSVSFENGSTEVPNFALEIDPTVDCTLTLKRYVGSSPLTLTPSVAGGNVMTAGKHYQVTCVGSYWTLAEFAMPSP